MTNVQSEYAKYRGSKSRYLALKEKLGGGILQVPVPRHFAGDWTISGPVSFHIYKKDGTIIYLFGDRHNDWSGTCSRPGAKEATSLLTYNANCMAKGNCITIQQFIERCGENLKLKDKKLDVFYEDNNLLSINEYNSNKLIVGNIIKEKKTINNPLKELIIYASICKTEKSCNGINMHPIDVRDTSKLYEDFDTLSEKLDNLEKHVLLRMLSDIQARIAPTEDSNMMHEHLLRSSINAIQNVLKLQNIQITNTYDMLWELLINDNIIVSREYNNFTLSQKILFDKMIMIHANKIDEQYDGGLRNFFLFLHHCIEETENLDKLKELVGSDNNIFFSIIKKYALLINTLTKGYEFIALDIGISIVDIGLYIIFEINKNPNKLVYTGVSHTQNYCNFLELSGYEKLYSNSTDGYSNRAGLRCQPVSIDFQKVTNFNF